MGINQEVADLRSAYSDLTAEIDAAAQRVLDLVASLQTKITSLGEVDPDIQADVDAMKAELAKVQAIAAAPAPEPTP